MGVVHVLKTWPVYFDAVQRGDKSFEVRKNDRAFQCGDEVILERFDPERPNERGSLGWEPIQKRIGWILHGGQFGIEPGYCVFALEDRATPARPDREVTP